MHRRPRMQPRTGTSGFESWAVCARDTGAGITVEPAGQPGRRVERVLGAEIVGGGQIGREGGRLIWGKSNWARFGGKAWNLAFRRTKFFIYLSH